MMRRCGFLTSAVASAVLIGAATPVFAQGTDSCNPNIKIQTTKSLVPIPYRGLNSLALPLFPFPQPAIRAILAAGEKASPEHQKQIPSIS